MSNLGILLAIGLLFAVVILIKKRRHGRLARVRAQWAQPIHRFRRLPAMAASHLSRLALTPGAPSLDERTWADLNLDDVLGAIDRTTSTLGQHALYHRLRTATVADDLAAFESLVERFRSDPSLREHEQLALERLQDPDGYDVWWLGHPDAVRRRAWYFVFPLLTAAAVAAIALSPLWPGVLLVLLINLLVRFITDRHIVTVAAAFRQCAPLVATAGSLRCVTGDEALRADVRKLARVKWISSWANANPLMLSVGSAPLSVMLSDFLHAVYEYLNLFLLLDASGVCLTARDLNVHRQSLLRVTAAIGDIDVAISVASLRDERADWARPQFRPDGPLTVTDLRHPLIAQAVPNSIELPPGRGVLVTGSNMSGKSTFLRTVGVNVILAQTLNTCLAREYAGPVLDVRSCIGRSDDLIAGKSYYLVEVEALLGLVRLSERPRPHLFLLDELFRGTNAVERVAAGHGVLQELLEGNHGRKPHVVIAATHDGELVSLLPESYDAYHFGDAIAADGLRFDHRLQRGPATTRTAIALLRQSGAPERLLDRATSTAAMLDRQRNT